MGAVGGAEAGTARLATALDVEKRTYYAQQKRPLGSEEPRGLRYHLHEKPGELLVKVATFN